MENRKPTTEMLSALQSFADCHGEDWKEQLSFAWMNGSDEREPNAHLLRQVRNHLGPSWLINVCPANPITLDIRPDRYIEHGQTLPDWEFSRWDDDGKPLDPKPGKVRWSNVVSPPKIGQVINVKMNSLGHATTTGYFTQDGWLGVLCKLHDAPDWHRQQNDGDPTGHVFGAELAII